MDKWWVCKISQENKGGKIVDYEVHPLGDRAILIEFGKEINEWNYEWVRKMSNLLENAAPEWLIEMVPSYTTLTLFYSPEYLFKSFQENEYPYQVISRELRRLFMYSEPEMESKERTIEIPVYYGGEFGPDLVHVAETNHLSEKEVIDIHSNGDYLVYMIGFAPGFPFMGGMAKKIATPRKLSPRKVIPAGTVGIAGEQTGIYPISTPGGWQLIGRTPLRLFNPDSQTPALLQAGDRIKFKSIDYAEYRILEEKEKC